MARGKIVHIDEERCNGCGLCIPACAEGALQIIDDKAKLISDKFCDGLGACLGHCPQDAITLIEREGDEFDEESGRTHHRRGKELERPDVEPLFAGCPSSKTIPFTAPRLRGELGRRAPGASMLTHWPVQLKLVPVHAPYFQDADLLVVADCVPFAYANFHEDFMKGKAVVVGCPKLDDIGLYGDKLTQIFNANAIRSITVPYMEVPCCFGLVKATEDALKASGKSVRLRKIRIGIQGGIHSEEEDGQGASVQRIR